MTRRNMCNRYAPIVSGGLWVHSEGDAAENAPVSPAPVFCKLSENMLLTH